jgi:hypothetical protein
LKSRDIVATQSIVKRGLVALVVAGIAGSGCALAEQSPSTDLEPFVCPVGGGGTNTDPYFNAYSAPGAHPLGAVATYPWQGEDESYPDGEEAFDVYGPNLPKTIACSDDHDALGHLVVTDGCLSVVEGSDGLPAGQVKGGPSDEAFRVVATSYTSDAPDLDIKYTDIGTQYRFFYSQQTGDDNFPGFKAFVRYRTEDNLYAASWRTDGVVQIQRKQCGTYTPLQVLPSFGAPAPNAWHTIEFTATGDQLDLTLDGTHVLNVQDDVFSWGTAGIRIDGMNGAFINDWKVVDPGAGSGSA